jgi:hypothetical protein
MKPDENKLCRRPYGKLKERKRIPVQAQLPWDEKSARLRKTRESAKEEFMVVGPFPQKEKAVWKNSEQYP